MQTDSVRETIRREYLYYIAADKGRTANYPPAYRIRATLDWLRLLRDRRAAFVVRFGADSSVVASEVAFTRDPAFLVNEAINRRGGWPQDPSGSRGTCMPVDGRFPKRAESDGGSGLRNLVYRLNGNFRVYRREVPARILRKLTPARIARLAEPGED